MINIPPDLLWKSIIEDFFEDFLRFFYPEMVDEIDFSKECGRAFICVQLFKCVIASEGYLEAISGLYAFMFMNKGNFCFSQNILTSEKFNKITEISKQNDKPSPQQLF